MQRYVAASIEPHQPDGRGRRSSSGSTNAGTACRADLLRRLGRTGRGGRTPGSVARQLALDPRSPAEREFLADRLAEIDS